MDEWIDTLYPLLINHQTPTVKNNIRLVAQIPQIILHECQYITQPRKDAQRSPPYNGICFILLEKKEWEGPTDENGK